LSIIEQNTLQIFAQSERPAKKIVYLKFQRMPRLPGSTSTVTIVASIAASIERNMRRNAARSGRQQPVHHVG
jgi:hypothetical protein